MALNQYTPYTPKMPAMPQIQPSQGLATPTTQINNQYAKSLLDNIGSTLKAPTGYFSKNNINDVLFPIQELGRQFINQNLLPEFQQNTYNPFQRQLANRAANSNLSLMGNANNYVQNQNRQVMQPFYNQAQQVQNMFNDQAQSNLDNMIKSWYNGQINI